MSVWPSRALFVEQSSVTPSSVAPSNATFADESRAMRVFPVFSLLKARPQPACFSSVLGLILTGALLAASPALAADPDIPPTITITGSGSISTVPDQAMLTGGVITEADTAAEALSANSAALSKTMGAITALGVDKRDLQTRGLAIQPIYDDGKGPRTIEAYRVSNSVTIRVRDLTRLGGLLDAMVSSGANSITGISFLVSDEDLKADEARKQAVADARRKAGLYADAADVKLGKILSITESGRTIPPPMAALRTTARSADVPVAAGEEQIGASVTIVWQLDEKSK